ncbi:MAG: metal-sensitive transcriptional regulator [Armatimonadota bacterium]
MDVVERLKRVEGQVRGLLRMITEGEDCRAVLTQMSAVRSALDRAVFLYVAAHMRDCLSRKASDPQAPTVEDMMEMFVRLA